MIELESLLDKNNYTLSKEQIGDNYLFPISSPILLLLF